MWCIWTSAKSLRSWLGKFYTIEEYFGKKSKVIPRFQNSAFKGDDMVLPIFSSKVHKTGHILERQGMRARYILVNLWQFEDDLPSETASTFTVFAV